MNNLSIRDRAREALRIGTLTNSQIVADRLRTEDAKEIRIVLRLSTLVTIIAKLPEFKKVIPPVECILCYFGF